MATKKKAAKKPAAKKAAKKKKKYLFFRPNTTGTRKRPLTYCLNEIRPVYSTRSSLPFLEGRLTSISGQTVRYPHHAQ